MLEERRSKLRVTMLQVLYDTATAARPTGSSTVLFEVSAVLYGPIGSLILTVVLVKDLCTVSTCCTAARSIYWQYRSSDWLLGSSSTTISESTTGPAAN